MKQLTLGLLVVFVIGVGNAIAIVPPSVVEFQPLSDRSGTDLPVADGVFDDLRDESDAHLFIATGSDWKRRSAMEFDLSSLPTGVSVVSANLRLNIQASAGTATESPKFVVHGYSGDGVVSLSDLVVFNPLHEPISGRPLRTLFIDVTPLVQTLSADYAGFMIDEVNGWRNTFTSKEGTGNYAGKGPMLRINYIPEPSTLLLASAASMGLRLRARRSI